MSGETEAILRAVEESEDEIIASLCDLVRIPTQAPPGENYGRIVDRLRPAFAEIGFETERIDMTQDVFEAKVKPLNPSLEGVRSNLVARMPDGGGPRVAVYCHLDTVPAGDPKFWAQDPFEPVVRDGYVFGRGTADSKAGVVAILAAFRVLHRLGIKPRIDPLVALITDEEVGGYSGLMYLADIGALDGCVLLHSTDGTNDSIAVGALGLFTWKIKIKGKSVHSGSAMLGNNPIERSHTLFTELLALKARVLERRSAFPATPSIAAATGSPTLMGNLSVTIAHGGFKHNVVPVEFVLEGDRRLLPEEDEATAIAEMEEAIARARAVDPKLECEFTTTPFYPSLGGSLDEPWLHHVKALAERAASRELPLIGGNGSTDTAYVWRTKGTRITLFGVAGPGSGNHSPEERVKISELIASTKAVALLAASEPPPARS